jgi:hypothetical protein
MATKLQSQTETEVCTDVGLVAQIMFGPGRVKMMAIKRCTESLGLSRPFLFRRQNLFAVGAYLNVGLRHKPHQLKFLGDFRGGPLPEIVRGSTLQTWHPRSISNAKITSVFLQRR